MDSRRSGRPIKKAWKLEDNETRRREKLFTKKTKRQKIAPQEHNVAHKNDFLDLLKPKNVHANFEKIHGKNAIGKFLRFTKKKHIATKLRSLYDKLPASTQCNATIGPIGSHGNTNCWICGIELLKPVKRGNTTKRSKPNKSSWWGICDHILPITQSQFYLNIFTKDSVPRIVYNFQESHKRDPTQGELDALVKEQYDKTYAWAHNVCNASKSGKIFIKKDPSNENHMIADDDKINSFLHGIANSIGIRENQETWVSKRENAMKLRLKPILEFINKNADFEGLKLLARTVALRDVKIPEADMDTSSGSSRRTRKIRKQ